MTVQMANRQAYIQIGNLAQMKLGKNITGDKLNRYVFNEDTPHNFGVKVNKIFTSTSRFYPKMFTNATIGSADKNYYTIDTNFYQWDLVGDTDLFIRVTKDVDDISENTAFISNGLIGQGQKEFFIDLDADFLSENEVIMLDNNEYMLVLTSDGMANGLSTRYSCKVQGSMEALGVPVDLLKQDSTVNSVSSELPAYGNPAKPGLGQFGTIIRLRNRVGKYGREFSVDEATIRNAMKANKGDGKLPSTNGMGSATKYQISPSDYVNGAVFAFGAWDKSLKDGKMTPMKSDGLMSFFEMKIEDMILMDREVMCMFGRASTTQTTTNAIGVNSTETQRVVAHGLRQLQKFGHYATHNGQLTVDDLQNYLDGVFMTRVDEKDRSTVFNTGTLGKIFLNQMVNIAAQGYFNSAKGDQFISGAINSTLANPLKFGYQFTQWIGLNGVEVTFSYDMMKDDRYYCRTMYTPNSTYTIDSARLEIFDFGNTNAGAENAIHMSKERYGGGSNCSMIVEDWAERRHWRIGCLHPYQGFLNTSSTDDTTAKYSRTLSGSPVIWDTTRIGVIVYDPMSI